MTFLIRSNAVWTIMTMNEAFSKSTDSSAGRALRPGKTNLRLKYMSIPEDKSLLLHGEQGPM